MKILLIVLIIAMGSELIHAQPRTDSTVGAVCGSPASLSLTLEGTFEYTYFKYKISSEDEMLHEVISESELFDASDTTYTLGDTIEIFSHLPNLVVGLQGPPHFIFRFQLDAMAHVLRNVIVDYYSGYYNSESRRDWPISFKMWELIFDKLPYSIDTLNQIHVVADGDAISNAGYDYRGLNPSNVFNPADETTTRMRSVDRSITSKTSFEATLTVYDPALSVISHSPEQTSIECTLAGEIKGLTEPGTEVQTITLLDVLGRSVREIQLRSCAREFRFEHLPAGLYFVRTERALHKVLVTN